MVVLKINGNKAGEFQNMAQALAFAHQNGACYSAETVEFIRTDGNTKTKNGKKQEAAASVPGETASGTEQTNG